MPGLLLFWYGVWGCGFCIGFGLPFLLLPLLAFADWGFGLYLECILNLLSPVFLSGVDHLLSRQISGL
ncbi:hypothetical protein [Streptomyces sp. NPDC059639]|uniref:hypothetical protein n=1 Tax=Streptomyces sp. NPDC059639 TaxID=3346891 RepID=UPI0036A8756E